MFYINYDNLDAFWQRHHIFHKFVVIVGMYPLMVLFAIGDGFLAARDSFWTEFKATRGAFHEYTPKKKEKKDNVYHV